MDAIYFSLKAILFAAFSRFATIFGDAFLTPLWTLFKSSKLDDGTLDANKFMSFLEEAKNQRANGGTSLNLLSEGTIDELNEAFMPILIDLNEQESRQLKTRLTDKGWLT